MENSEYVVALIRAVMDVQAYPLASDQDAPVPFIIWSMTAGEEEALIGSPSRFREETYNFTLVASTYEDTVRMRNDLRNLLQNSSPLMFVNGSEEDSYDVAEFPGLYIKTLAFSGVMPMEAVVNPQVVSASYAETASYVSGSTLIATSASYATNAGTASYFVGFIESASFAARSVTSSYALTASYVSGAITLPDGLVSSSAQVLNNTGIYSSSAQLPSGLVSASSQVDYNYIQNKPEAVVTASYAITASYAPTKDGVVSSSTQFKSSDQFTIGALSAATIYTPSTLNVGGLSQLYRLELWPSGSTTTTEKITIGVGSLRMGDGNLIVTGSVKVKGAITGSLLGTASYALIAVSASYAPLPSGVVSSSAQILVDSGVYSSSAQLPAGLVSASAQVFQDSGVYSSSLQLPAGIYSSSAQLPVGIISSSAQLPTGVVSSSAQVLEGSSVYSSSAQLPSGIVSGSTQIVDWSVATASYAVTASYALNGSGTGGTTIADVWAYSTF